MNIPSPDYREQSIALYLGDCLHTMDLLIQYNIKVDAIITDPPYGTTACKWDSVIPFDEMWLRLRKLRNEETPIILFGSEPFSSALRMSNIKEYKYDWVWDKVLSTGHLNSKKMPLLDYENICVFGIKYKYYPIMSEGEKPNALSKKDKVGSIKTNVNTYGASNTIRSDYGLMKFPKRIITFKKIHSKYTLHPTQKPVELLEYLIKTYTNEGDIVLDFMFGSGTTGVACKKLNRKFIGIEKDKTYFDIAVKRIQETEVLDKTA